MAPMRTPPAEARGGPDRRTRSPPVGASSPESDRASSPDSPPTLRRVVVTGLGAITPCGLDAPTSWEAAVAGRSGIGPITKFDTTDWSVRIAGEVEGFEPASLSRAERKRMDTFTQYAVVASLPFP